MGRLLRTLILLVGFAPGSAAPVSARAVEDTSYVSALARAQSEFVDELEELAALARRLELLLEADTCYRQILALDVDHSLARKALRYSRRGGAWVQSASYRQPRNFSKDSLEAFAADRDEAVERFKGFVFELNEKHKGAVSLERRERAMLQLLDVLPEDPEVRAALGEGLVDGEWRLLETANARQRRALIPDLARRCVATAPEGSPVDPNGLEQALGLDFRLILETPYIRVAGTGEPEEVRKVLAVSQGAGEFFRSLLDNETLPRVGFSIYLLAHPGEKERFLNAHPRIDPRDRPYLESLESAGIPKTGHTAEWSTTEALRLDRSTRQSIGSMLSDTYKITTDNGWAWEGFGIYLTYQLVGTRLTYYVRPDKYAGDANATALQKALFARLFHPESDWINEARVYFLESGRRPPRLAILTGRKIDSLAAQDLLWSYVVAAYLLEGWPDATPVFLHEIGQGTPTHEAVRKAFEMELPRFETRIERWLDEAR
jgi:hypothetical protein